MGNFCQAAGRQAKLSARPAIVIFTNEVERIRIAGVLRRFHFQTVPGIRRAPAINMTPRTLGKISRAAVAEGKTVDVGVH